MKIGNIMTDFKTNKEKQEILKNGTKPKSVPLIRGYISTAKWQNIMIKLFSRRYYDRF